MLSSSEFLPLIDKLIAKSAEGKVPWKGTYEDMVFAAVLETVGTFQVRRDPRGNINLTMRDEDNKVVLELSAWPVDEETSQENDSMFRKLEELYERARRSALRVDEVVNRASDILDKL